MWEEVYGINYVSVVDGSSTVDVGKMDSDFDNYYLNNQYFEFDAMTPTEKNSLIYKKKKSAASGDVRNASDNYGIVVNEGCIDELLLNGLPEISKMVQFSLSVLKEAAKRIVAQEAENAALKQRLNLLEKP